MKLFAYLIIALALISVAQAAQIAIVVADPYELTAHETNLTQFLTLELGHDVLLIDDDTPAIPPCDLLIIEDSATAPAVASIDVNSQPSLLMTGHYLKDFGWEQNAAFVSQYIGAYNHINIFKSGDGTHEITDPYNYYTVITPTGKSAHQIVIDDFAGRRLARGDMGDNAVIGILESPRRVFFGIKDAGTWNFRAKNLLRRTINWILYNTTDSSPVLDYIADVDANATFAFQLHPTGSDYDNDTLAFSFTEPLNETGGWQTRPYDGGLVGEEYIDYHATVSVTDGIYVDSQVVRIRVFNYDFDGDSYDKSADCNDYDPAINPAAVDIPYDGIDQDCDGSDLIDVDGDSHDYTIDCNDNDPLTYPGAAEIPYDSIDQDCDGFDLIDVDSDGYDYTLDCDDANASIYPGAAELCNGKDDDCNSLFDELFDSDFDTYTTCGTSTIDGSYVGVDCDDSDPVTNPGNPEIPYDGIDQDCSGSDLIDVDNDSYNYTVDCNDYDAAIYPGAPEVVDEIDQNCVNDRPIVLSSPATAASEDVLYIYTVGAVDYESDPISYSLIASPAGMQIDLSGIVTWTPSQDQVGSHDIRIRVADAGGYTEQLYILQVSPTNDAPVLLDYMPAITLDEDTNFTINVSGYFYDEDGDALSYSVTAAVGVSFIQNGPLFTVVPNHDYFGGDVVIFTADDQHGGVVQSNDVQLTVSSVNDAPTITSSPPLQAVQGQLYSYQITAADPDSSTLYYAVYAGPLGMTVSESGLVEWVPQPDQVASQDICVYVTDTMLEGMQCFTLGVENVNDAPALDEIQDIDAFENDTIILALSAQDYDSDNLTFSMESFPPGSSLAGNTFTWAPGFDQEGVYTIRFIVTDSFESDSQEVTFTISNLDRAPTIEQVGAINIDEDEQLTLNLIASDPDGDELLYTADTLPRGASLVGSTFSWTPDFIQAGMYNITFQATDGYLDANSQAQIIVGNVNLGPVFEPIPDQSAAEGVELVIQLKATDPDGDTVTYSMYNEPEGGTLTGDIFSFTPGYSQTGTYYMVFIATDRKINATQGVSITVNNTNQLPQLAHIDNITAVENFTVSIYLNATDADNDTLEFFAENLPVGSSFAGNHFEWIPSFTQSEIYDVTFGVTDGKDNVTQAVNIEVLNSENHAPVLSEIGNWSVSENSTLDIEIEATDMDNDTLEYFIGGMPAGATLVGNIFSWSPGMDESGSYNLVFGVTDGELNATEAVAIHVINLDRYPVLDEIPDLNLSEGDLLRINLTATDPDNDTLSYYGISLPPSSTLSGNEFTWLVTYTEAGEYDVTFVVSDGELTDNDTVHISVADVNQAPILEAVGSVEGHEGEQLQIELVAFDFDSDNLTYFMSGAPNSSELTGNIFTWTPGYDDEGLYFMTFGVTDSHVNVTQDAVLIIYDTNRPPEFEDINDTFIMENETLQLNLSATDPDGDTLIYSAENLPDGATLTGNSFEWRPRFNQAGIYNVTFTVSDGRANVSQDVDIIVIDAGNHAPVFDEIWNLTGVENSTVSFRINARDIDLDTLNYSALSIPVGAIFENQTFSWNIDFNDAGYYTLVFMVDDGIAHVTLNISLLVENVNRLPVFGDILDINSTENTTITFNVTATDPDNESLRYAVADAPDSSLFENSTFTWIPDFRDASSYTLIFAVTDGIATVNEPVLITVTDVNQLPEFKEVEDQTIMENETLQLNLSATDPDNDTLIYSAENLPDGAALAGNSFEWRPRFNQAGLYNVTFTVSDGKANVSQDVAITVVEAGNHAPVFIPVANQSGYENSTIIFTVNAVDIDFDNITYEADYLPEGAAFENQTFSWETGFNDAGDYIVTITADDGINASIIDVNVHVENVNRLPDFEQIADLNITENSSVLFNVHATDPDNDTLRYSVAHGPDGAVFDHGFFFWYADFDAAGDYNVTFTVTDGYANVSQDVLIHVENVNRAPVFWLILERAVTEGELLEINLTATDPDGDNLTFSAGELPEGASLSGNLFSWIPSYAQAGVYTVVFSVTDGMYTVSQPTLIVVNEAGNQAPVFIQVPPQAVQENSTLQFTVTAIDPENESYVNITAAIEPPGATFVDNIFTYTPGFDAAGNYTAKFVATDSHDAKSSMDVLIAVTDLNRLPELGFIADVDAVENDTITISLGGSDPDGQRLTFYLENAPAGADIARLEGESTFVWQPGFDQAGSYVVRFGVTDGIANDTQDVAFAISNLNRMPVFDPLQDYIIHEGESLVITLHAADPDLDNLTFTGEGMPGGSSLSGSTFAWTPGYFDAGEYVVTFTVSDGEYDVQRSTKITVLNSGNMPPVFDPVENKTVVENSTLVFRVHAIDPDGDDVHYDADSLPAGAAFSGDTFSWKPGFEQAGKYTVRFTANDSKSVSYLDVYIDARNLNRRPTVAAEDVYATEGDLVALEAHAYDPDGDALTLGYSAPLDSTGRWQTEKGDAGDYNVTVTATDGYLFATAVAQLHIAESPNHAPQLDPIDDITVIEGGTVQISAQASDPDGDAVYIYYSYPLDANGIWQTEKGDARIYFANVTASDGVFNTTREFIITVLARENQQPGITNIHDMTVVEGDKVKISPIILDDDYSAIVTISEPVGDDGIWQTEKGDAGAYNITVCADDRTARYCENIILTVVRESKAGLVLEHITLSEDISPGSELVVRAVVRNTGKTRLRDIRVSASIPDEGLFRGASGIDINPGDSRMATIVLDTSELPGGAYTMRIVASSSGLESVKHRDFEVR